MTVRKLRDLATALMDQYPDDSEEWFVLRFAARCQSDPDTAVLFLKRNALLSLATRDSRVASYLLSGDDESA
jgi:hypothetical protein